MIYGFKSYKNSKFKKFKKNCYIGVLDLNIIYVASGPGCSSLGVGAFSENGPFRPNGEVLLRNEYSWNRGTYLL